MLRQLRDCRSYRVPLLCVTLKGHAEGRCLSCVYPLQPTLNEVSRGGAARSWLHGSKSATMNPHDRTVSSLRSSQECRRRAAHASAAQDHRRGAESRERRRRLPHDEPVTPLKKLKKGCICVHISGPSPQELAIELRIFVWEGTQLTRCAVTG